MLCWVWLKKRKEKEIKDSISSRDGDRLDSCSSVFWHRNLMPPVSMLLPPTMFPWDHETVDSRSLCSKTYPASEGKEEQSELNMRYLNGKYCLLFFLSSDDKILALNSFNISPQYFAPKHCHWSQQMGAQRESQIYWTHVKWKGSFPP